MIDPTRPRRTVIGARRGLAQAAADVGKTISPDGMAVDLKDGQAPVFVPKALVEELTGSPMPIRALRCRRTKDRGKSSTRRKQAKASRKRNR